MNLYVYIMKIIDAHSHVEYITHNFQSDVVGTVCCATNESQWGILVNMMKTDSRIFGAFGIHPWFLDSVSDGFESRLNTLLSENSKFMVGEIGLDKYKPDMDKQIEAFEKQFNIAVNLHCTISMHCVGAWDKIFHILNKYRKSDLPNIIAHSYSGNLDITKRLLDSGYNIMFSFAKIDKTRDFSRIEQIPANRFLVESDAKNNIILSETISQIQNIKQCDNLSDIIYNNASMVLKNE